MIDMELQYRVEQFLYREAELLDNRQFDDWLALFTEDAEYVAPVISYEEEPKRTAAAEGFAIFDDDRRYLGMRIARLASNYAHAEQPPSITRHTVSNVRVEESKGSLEIRSNFIVFQGRSDGSELFFVGERADTLKPVGDTFNIRRREIRFDQRTLPRTISILF